MRSADCRIPEPVADSARRENADSPPGQSLKVLLSVNLTLRTFLSWTRVCEPEPLRKSLGPRSQRGAVFRKPQRAGSLSWRDRARFPEA